MATANIFDLADTWTDGGTTYTAIKMDVTDTASAAGSKLLDLLVGGASKFSVDKTGAATASGLTVSGGSVTLSGNISAAAWTTSGIRFKGVAATLTDTSSSGTVAAAYTNVYGGNTIAASSAATYTDYITTHISQPTAGTNVTFTNRWALGLSGAMKVSGQSLTGSQAQALFDLAATWNTTGAPTALKLDVTDTASASGSKLFDLLVSGTSRFAVEKGANALFGTASLRLGAADAASPVAQTFSVQNVVAGTSNTAGANLTIAGSRGTGTGAGGSIIFQTAAAGSSGTSQNALTTALTIDSGGSLITSRIYSTTRVAFGNAANNGLAFSSNEMYFVRAGTSVVSFSSDNALAVRSTYAIGWTPGVADASAPDLTLLRDAADTLALRRTTNAQTLRMYLSYTDASNYTRLALKTAAGVQTIETESAGTGESNIDLALTPKGTGRVRFGTHAATTTETVTGYIEIKDSGGTTRKIAVVS